MKLNKDWYEGKLKFDGKEYPVAVVKGIRYIDGKTINEFLKTLSPNKMAKFAQIGIMVLRKDKNANNKRN